MTPRVDDGRFPVKRVVGDALVVEADVFADGHDEIRAVLAVQTSATTANDWRETEMEPLGNDRWRADVPVCRDRPLPVHGRGWVDRSETWRHDLAKRVEANQDVTG